jgi:hypothetical protein
MVLALAHLFGMYNPTQLADFLDLPHQSFSTHLKTWSLYHLKATLMRFMVTQASEQLGPVLARGHTLQSRLEPVDR